MNKKRIIALITSLVYLVCSIIAFVLIFNYTASTPELEGTMFEMTFASLMWPVILLAWLLIWFFIKQY